MEVIPRDIASGTPVSFPSWTRGGWWNREPTRSWCPWAEPMRLLGRPDAGDRQCVTVVAAGNQPRVSPDDRHLLAGPGLLAGANRRQAIREAIGAGLDWMEYLRLVDRHRTPALSWAALGRVPGIGDSGARKAGIAKAQRCLPDAGYPIFPAVGRGAERLQPRRNPRDDLQRTDPFLLPLRRRGAAPVQRSGPGGHRGESYLGANLPGEPGLGSRIHLLSFESPPVGKLLAARAPYRLRSFPRRLGSGTPLAQPLGYSRSSDCQMGQERHLRMARMFLPGHEPYRHDPLLMHSWSETWMVPCQVDGRYGAHPCRRTRRLGSGPERSPESRSGETSTGEPAPPEPSVWASLARPARESMEGSSISPDRDTPSQSRVS